MGIKTIQDMCDSRLVVGYETANAPYVYALNEVHAICKRFKEAIFQLGGDVITTHTVREGNSLADKQANEAIAYQGPTLVGDMAIRDADFFANVDTIKSWYGQPSVPPVVWDDPTPKQKLHQYTYLSVCHGG